MLYNVISISTGGFAPNPTYQSIQDHTEAFIVEYNPDKLTFQDILEEWSGLDYPLAQQSTQYRSAVFALNAQQHADANTFVQALERNLSDQGPIYSTVEPITRFYRGEEYHQDFLAKQKASKSLKMF